MSIARAWSRQHAARLSASITYAGLAVVILGIYALIVVGPLVLTGGSDDGNPGLALPIVASAVVAVVFEPIRSRLRQLADRLVFGDRVSPYEVLSRVTASYPDVAAGNGIGDLAQLLARGTGADRAIVWVTNSGTLRAAAMSPEASASAIEPVGLDGLVDDDVTASRLVVHHGVTYGALTIVKPGTDPTTPDDHQLLSDVAAASGLLLRNISLNHELEQRAADVRASRRRLIAARDAERHRLERDLHDGAQQQVVALKVKLGIARRIAQNEGAEEIVSRVTSLADETQRAVDALRAVAHGIYPPLLETEGLDAALRAVERTSPIPVTVSVQGLGRLGVEVEETAYFCVVETLEHARMAGASTLDADLAADGPHLIISLSVGGCRASVDLTSITDRIEAAGGMMTVDERSGGEMRITSTVPVVVTAARA
ncbi:MAG: histidine kinase [Actinomycetota bacterium]